MTGELSCMDRVEVELISKFFGIDCFAKINPNLSLIEKLPAESSKNLRKIGSSNFRNIVAFYRFEYKPNEEVFWSNFQAAELLADVEIDLIVSKLPFDYLWLDFVTDTHFKFEVINNSLRFNHFQLSDNYYLRSLELVVKMIFLSDFKRENANVCIQKEWDNLFVELAELNKQIRGKSNG